MSGQTFYFYGGNHTHHYFTLTLNPKKGGTVTSKDEVSKIYNELVLIHLKLITFANLFDGNGSQELTVDETTGVAQILHGFASELETATNKLE